MAGWTVIASHRECYCTISIVTGTASVTYPITNLYDPSPYNYALVTPDANVVRILFQMATAVLPVSNTDQEISGFFLANHNLDGAVWTLVGHTANNYAAGTVFDTGTLDQAIGFPNMLRTFTPGFKRFWWLNLDTTLATSMEDSIARIGVAQLGPAFDLGVPMLSSPLFAAKTTSPFRSGAGYKSMPRWTEPVVTKRVSFDGDSTALGKNAIYDRSVGSLANTYRTYQTLWPHLRTARQQRLNSSGSLGAYATGLGMGSGVPVGYHEGTANGLTGGRPAYYGEWTVTLVRDTEGRQLSRLDVEIEDALGSNSIDVAPFSG